MTAVEWLIDQMFKQGYFDGNKPLSITNLDHLQHQAKEMEKQQIIKSRENGISEGYRRTNNFYYDKMVDSDIYYAKTYGSKGSDETKTNNMEYRKKPVVIEAFKYGTDNRPDWFNDKVTSNKIITYVGTDIRDSSEYYCEIKTLEGIMRGNCGDYIIKGVQGEVYACKPDIFEMTYELASTSSQTEISDEEIEKGAIEYYESAVGNLDREIGFRYAIKWHREQLKKKQ